MKATFDSLPDCGAPSLADPPGVYWNARCELPDAGRLADEQVAAVTRQLNAARAKVLESPAGATWAAAAERLKSHETELLAARRAADEVKHQYGEALTVGRAIPELEQKLQAADERCTRLERRSSHLQAAEKVAREAVQRQLAVELPPILERAKESAAATCRERQKEVAEAAGESVTKLWASVRAKVIIRNLDLGGFLEVNGHERT
jgi:hypothetical protein